MDERIGLLFRGDRDQAGLPTGASRLEPLFAAFAALGASAEPVVYADDALDDVRAQLLGLDGLLVWVNPVQDGATRAQLDALLREVAAAGVWVSAHPDVIDTMGTKEVLFATRSLGWGGDIALYRSPEEFAELFPTRLGRLGRLVVKQARGTAGAGVWRVELAGAGRGRTAVSLDSPILVQRSTPREITPLEESSVGAFVEECRGYFAWSGCFIDQPYQERLAEGMIRVYLVHDEVVGFCHQWPKGLLDPAATEGTTGATGATEGATGVPTMDDPDLPAYAQLRRQVETEWVPGMQQLLGIRTHDLPAIWDADFLYGPKTDVGADTYVLCEVNVQAVWPYPPQASDRLARAALDRVRH